MPTYEQVCPECGKSFEVDRKITDDSPVFCPDCGHETRRLISRTAFVLKDGASGGWASKSYATEKPADPPAPTSGKKEL